MDGCLVPEVVDGLVAGKLDDAAAALAEAHIDTCRRCRVLVAQLAKDAATAVERPNARPSQPSDAPKVIDRYRIDRRLGAGGMGVVYLAHDPELDRKVVIKLLRAEVATLADRARLMREAQAMAKVSHANVVPIFDVGVHDDQIFLAMELVDGQDLAAWLAQPRDVKAVLEVFVAAGRGLAAAHRAGLVHRDFKPHNVMLATSGEVKVTDFGLARAETAPVEERKPIREHRASLLASPITNTGAMVGTPAYMAPEQILMHAIDARTDQFSFCVALYEGLYGERPFHGKTVEELFESTLDGKPRFEKRGVPVRVRAALRRGLSVEPNERFPTMDALLAELAPRSRTGLAIAGVAVLALGAGGIAFAMTRDEKLCTGASAALAGVWNPQRAKDLEASFVARDATLGPPRFHALQVGIDRYAQAWIAAHGDACGDTRIRGDQTEAMMERRMTCLRQRRGELAATLDVLATGSTLPDIEPVLDRLPSPALCDNTAGLDQPIADPKLRAAVEELEAELARIDALVAATRAEEAGIAIRPLVERAEKVGHAPLLAELHVRLGELAGARLDWSGAQTWFDRAVETAEKAGSDRMRGRAYVAQVEAAAMLGKLDDADRYARFARGVLERVEDRKQIAQLDRMVAWTQRERGQTAEAAKTYQRAIDAMIAITGPNSRDVAMIQQEYGQLLYKTYDYDAAYAMFEKARATYIAAGTAESPGAALALSLLAQVRYSQGRYDDALALGTQSQNALKAYYGEGHPYVLAQYTMYAPWLQAAGKNDEALALMRKTAELTREQLGATNPRYPSTLSSLGVVEYQLGKYAEAAETFEKARAAFVAIYKTEEHADVVTMQNAVAQMRIKQERYDDALALLARSREIVAKVQPTGPLAAETLTYIGSAQTRAGRPVEGVKVLEEALAMELAIKAGPAETAWTKVELAKALVAAKRDKPRAIALAKEALGEAEAAGDRKQRDAAQALLQVTGASPPR